MMPIMIKMDYGIVKTTVVLDTPIAKKSHRPLNKMQAQALVFRIAPMANAISMMAVAEFVSATRVKPVMIKTNVYQKKPARIPALPPALCVARSVVKIVAPAAKETCVKMGLVSMIPAVFQLVTVVVILPTAAASHVNVVMAKYAIAPTNASQIHLVRTLVTLPAPLAVKFVA